MRNLLSFFFFSFVFFKFYFIFKLYNIVLVLPNIEMNPPQKLTVLSEGKVLFGLSYHLHP